MTQSKLTFVRFSIPTGTQPESPVSVRISLPQPVIKSINVWWNAASAQGVMQFATGWKISHGGGLLIPSQGSYDGLTNFGYCAFPYIGGTVLFDDMDIKVQGPPYELILDSYNTGAAVSYAYFAIQTIPLIELPAAPITGDQKKND